MLLAWTGNDPARRLNLAVSSDGVRFDKMTTMTRAFARARRWPPCRRGSMNQVPELEWP